MAGPGTWRTGCCPVADLVARGLVAPESADAIVTDPPCPREYLPAWSDLARFAAAALRPGGFLAALSGQSWLPDVLRRLDVPGIVYRWTMAVLLPGAAVKVWNRNLSSQWKPPIVCERAGGQSRGGWLDVIGAGGRRWQAGAFHAWGQSPESQDAIADRLLRAGDVVIDPFAGGGETALAAWRWGRHVAAFDSDPAVAAALAEAVSRNVTATGRVRRWSESSG